MDRAVPYRTTALTCATRFERWRRRVCALGLRKHERFGFPSNPHISFISFKKLEYILELVDLDQIMCADLYRPAHYAHSCHDSLKLCVASLASSL